MTRAAVGRSTASNAARAALEVAAEVRDGLGGATPTFCIAFVTGEHVDSLPSLLETLGGAVGTPYVVGCQAAGVLTGGWEAEEGPALAVLAVASDAIRATPFLFDDQGDQGMTAGVRLGQRMIGSRDTDDLLLVWPDPFHVRPDRLLQSLDAVLHGMTVVGGASSSQGLTRETKQFCGTECSGASVSGVRLAGDFHRTVAVTQGCRPLGDPLRVTRSHENLILEIDGRPALEVLREHAPPDLLRDMRIALHFLFVGLLPDPGEPELRPGEYLVRNIIDADPDTGVLAVADRVEEGQHVVLVEREPGAARADLRRMLEGVSTKATGREYRFGLYFNCLARGRTFYREPAVDATLLAEYLPGVPVLGFFCNAEIGPLRGSNHLFTYTGVLALFGD